MQFLLEWEKAPYESRVTAVIWTVKQFTLWRMALQVSVLQSEDQQTSLYSLVRVWFSTLLIELVHLVPQAEHASFSE